MVVSGYASREVANNDLQRIVCPNIPQQSSEQQLQVCLYARWSPQKASNNYFLLGGKQRHWTNYKAEKQVLTTRSDRFEE